MKLVLAAALLCLHLAHAEDDLRADLREFVSDKLMSLSGADNCGQGASCGTTCNAKDHGFCSNNKKCKPEKNKVTCNPDCGCLSCPCCQYSKQEDESIGKYCPPEDSEQCSAYQDRSFELGDPIGCFADFVASGELVNTNKKCEAIQSKEQCNKVTFFGGNECQWFEYQGNGQSGGECVTNPCSNINDGSCTLQQTGGRCVWYGHPKRLRQLFDEDGNKVQMEFPNPYGNWAGCYSTPCTSPIYSYTDAVGDTVTVKNNIRSCTARNSIGYTVPGQLNEDGLPKEEGTDLTWKYTPKSKSPYLCEWCNLGHRGTTGGGKMGCQNTKPISYARCARIAGQEKHGKCPCLNDFCRFYQSPNTRTNVGPELETFGNGKNAVRCEYRADGPNGQVRPKLVPQKRTAPPTSPEGRGFVDDTAGKSKVRLQRERDAALDKMILATELLDNKNIADVFKIPDILGIMEGPLVTPPPLPTPETQKTRNEVRAERNKAVGTINEVQSILDGDDVDEEDKLEVITKLLTT